MADHNPGSHVIQFIGLAYQYYYMMFEQCWTDYIAEDIITFCWNGNCDIEDVGKSLKKNWLYMTREIILSGIVWWEGVPSSTS
jgi:hypothetical protein